MTLTGAGSNVMGGAYIGPHTGTINGVSTPVICDDFAAESYISEAWTANTSTFAGGFTYVKFAGGTETQNYEEAADLALELLAAPVNSERAGQIQYAPGDLFTPGALNGLNSADAAAAQNDLTNAANNYSSYFSLNPGQWWNSPSTPRTRTMRSPAEMAHAYPVRRRNSSWLIRPSQ
jgi:hypothetical protein